MEEYLELLQDVSGRAGEVRFATETVAAQAREHGIVMLSHDDTSAEMRTGYRQLGARIAEFPLNFQTVESASAAGDVVVLGAPNVVRGGSHNGAISAEEAIRRKQCHVLASDYYYPSLRYAALKLAREGVLSFEAAWSLVSATPAQAAGLYDRGTLAVGKRADIIIVHEHSQQVVHSFSNGKSVFRAR